MAAFVGDYLIKIVSCGMGLASKQISLCKGNLTFASWYRMRSKGGNEIVQRRVRDISQAFHLLTFISIVTVPF